MYIFTKKVIWQQIITGLKNIHLVLKLYVEKIKNYFRTQNIICMYNFKKYEKKIHNIIFVYKKI